MRYDAEVERAADTYQLGLLRMPSAGRSGELLGRGTGSSLEFQEYREYTPGDDIRHLDWGAYARSDMLMVRLFREEISPRTEILLDASRSMASSRAKEQVARQLAALFAVLSGRLGGRPTVVPLKDDAPQPLSLDGLDRLPAVSFAGRTNLGELLAGGKVPLRRQAVRIVISDFLFPHDPAALVRRLSAEASALWIIQVLGEWESAPTPLGGRRMIDIELGSEAEVVIDRAAIREYRAKLEALQEELVRNCRRAHAAFAATIAERGLQALCREDLCAAGMLRVA